MMKPILIIQSDKTCTAGNILDYFNQNSISYQLFHAYNNDTFPDLENFDAVINLGHPASINDYQEHTHLQNLYAYVGEIIKINKPYLGICFGAQMLAKILGAKVQPNKVREAGTYEVSLTEDGINDPIFKNISQPFQVFQWHGDTFQIPFGATHLATSADCTNQSFRKNKAVGFQFHAETRVSEMENWSDLYPENLKEINKTKAVITSSCNMNADTVQSNCFQLIENFISTL